MRWLGRWEQEIGSEKNIFFDGRFRLECGTLWLKLNQMAELFGRDKSVTSKHVKRIIVMKRLSIVSVELTGVL